MDPLWKGDGPCDDGNNNCGCEWDGGDCCGDNVNTDYCSACECLDPNANSDYDISTTSMASTSTTTSACSEDWFIGDSICDDGNNNEDCEWDGGDCCGTNVVCCDWCSACECLDPNTGNSKKQTIYELVSDYRKIKNPRKNSISKRGRHKEEVMSGLRPLLFGKKSTISPIPNLRKYSRYLGKEDRLSRSRSQHFTRKNEIMPNHHFRNHPIYGYAKSTHPNYFDWQVEMLLNPELRKKSMKRSISTINLIQYKANIGKTNTSQLTQLQSTCEGKKGTTYQKSSIVCNHLASSVEGLRVKLNPNVEEYKTDAVKNNFIGFKYLVHSPYDFPYVDEVGKAMGPNIQSYIGFLGFHSWITDAADAYIPEKKKCASKRDIVLDVFEDYTRTNCMFECKAKSIFKNCGCLPYQYPEFHLANTGIWKDYNSTACNYTQLICLSRVKGILFQFDY